MTISRRLSSESGVAIPVALAVLFVTAGLATVTARAAIVSSHQSFRNTNVKRAVQAAGAGIRVVMYQMNLMQPAGDQCVHKGAGGALTNGAVQGDGWCAPQTEDLGDNGGLQRAGLVRDAR